MIFAGPFVRRLSMVTAYVAFAVVGAILERYLVREVKARYEVVERVLQRLVDGGLDPKRTTGEGGSGPPT